MTPFAQHALDKAVRLARVVPRSQSVAAPAPTSRPIDTNTIHSWVARQKKIASDSQGMRDWLFVASDAIPVRLRIEDIQRVVAVHYRVSRQDILSARRTANIVRPRQVAMYLAKTLTLRSLPEIGRRFGGRDHSTVLHAVRKIEALTKTDIALHDEVEALKRQLQEVTHAGS